MPIVAEIVPEGGMLAGPPLRVALGQIVLRNGDGTVIFVAAEYGNRRSQVMAKVGDPDFGRICRLLGIHETVVIDTIELPKPPPGAKLIAGPKPGE